MATTSLIQTLSFLLPMLLLVALVAGLAALWRAGLDSIAWLIAAPFRLLPRPLRGLAFTLALVVGLWAFTQRAPAAPPLVPTPPAVVTATTPMVFLPFVAR